MRKKYGTLFLISGALLVACSSPPDPLKLYDELVVQTNFDPETNFSSYTTYSISTDTLGLVSNNINDDTIIVGNNFARPVITEVINNLSVSGFQRVGRHENPDVAINVFVVKNLDVFQEVNYYNPYGPGYPGYFGNSGYYYPSYYGYSNYYYGYPYVSTYVSNNQVLVIEMVDLKNVSLSGQVKVVWNTYMGDLYTSLDRNAQTIKGIAQAFAQSSYLSKHPKS